jgi:hypothetical protein
MGSALGETRPSRTTFALEESMTTAAQTTAARKNIKKAAAAARKQRTIAHLSKKTRTALGKQGAAVKLGRATKKS